MTTRINVVSTIADARAITKKKEFGRFPFGKKIRNVIVADSYTISRDLDASEVEKVTGALVQSSVEETLTLSSKKYDWAVEIGFLPGVTDNVGATVKETIEDLLKIKFRDSEHVFSSRVYLIEGPFSKDEVVLLSADLYNSLIQGALIYSSKELASKQLPPYAPEVKISSHESMVSSVDLSINDQALEILGKKGIQNQDGTYRGPLALDLDSLHAIQAYFKSQKRVPTDIELESIAQTWSEHCKHTIFANPIDTVKEGLYKAYIQKATKDIRKKKGKKDFCVSVFTDNAGGITFDKDFIVTHKVETHNSPSALDPFGGAITGIVGVNRDAMGFGLGAKPIANVYGFCFADPNDTRSLYRDQKLTQKMLSPKRIMEGVIAGVNAGGNCSGIPTVQGFAYFNDRFRGKPLVFVGTVGLIPKKIGTRKSWEKKANVGDYIVMVGGRVGLDGIHGATFSSVVMDSGSPATAVQIGDPITQKKMSDAIIKEARDKNLFSSITDNGAGGISCSVAEMARECGGCRVDLEKVPLKYPGLLPWQIWISESQERMTLSVPKGKWKAFSELMTKRGVEATIIGEFIKEKKCIVREKGKVIMDLDMSFLHGGLPKKQMRTKMPMVTSREPKLPKTETYSETLRTLISRLNLGSHAFITRQYDHEVQASSVMKPLIGTGQVDNDTAIIRPVPTSLRGVALSSALYPTYSEIDPYAMAASAIDTAIRNLVTVGVSPDEIAILDNFCWCSSYDPARLWQLKQAVKSCYDYAVSYGTPFISGKDSMFNDFKGYDAAGKPVAISVPPTLLVSSMGLLPDITKTVSPDFKYAGDHIYVLGDTKDECGGSEWYLSLSELQGEQFVGTKVPQVNAAKNLKLYRKLHDCIQKDLVASSTSVHRGGLGIALAKSALAGGLGIDVTLSGFAAKSVGTMLFSETQGRIVVSVSPKNKAAFEKAMKGAPVFYMGVVTGAPKIICRDSKKKPVLELPLSEATTLYQKTFKNY